MDNYFHIQSLQSVEAQEKEYNFCNLISRINMVEYSGYARVANRACTDIKRKDYLRRLSENEVEFKQMWRMECRKKEEKLHAMQKGLWKTQMNRESSLTDDVPSVLTVRKGRFLITVCNDAKKKDDRKPTVVKKGRFLVTKHYVCVKKEPAKPPKPTVTRKGRFLITLY
jgi:hypothetical protein